MALAVLSDIHANLPALEAVLGDIQARPLEGVYCLGDLVGYAPFPNEVTARIRAERIPTIMGNYDDGVGFDREECGCAYREAGERMRGQQSLEWTKARVTTENKAFLRTLLPEIRLTVNGKRLLLVHGSPRRMNEYLFEDRPLTSFQRLAAASNADVIVFGHTHRPYVKLVDHVWFVNVGSVGKPKDGNRHACYALVDVTAEPPASFVRVPYDVDTVTRAIRASELPHEFAADLESGGAPPPGR
jgi:putative phosphoesterase